MAASATLTLEDCAANGAKELDKVKPHWFLQLDFSRLDMFDCRNCVWGQLYGTYLKLRGVFRNNPTKHGLDVPLLLLANQDVHERLAFAWWVQVNHRRFHTTRTYT